MFCFYDFDIRFWNCSYSGICFVFTILILDFGIVPTVGYVLFLPFWYLILELFLQWDMFCFYHFDIRFVNCSYSGICFVFTILIFDFGIVPTVGYVLFLPFWYLILEFFLQWDMFCFYHFDIWFWNCSYSGICFVFTILIFDFGIVPTVGYVLFLRFWY